MPEERGHHSRGFCGSVSGNSAVLANTSQGQQTRTACRTAELALGVGGRQG